MRLEQCHVIGYNFRMAIRSGKWAFTTILTLLSQVALAEPKAFDVTFYGALGDDRSDDQTAITAAIAAATAAGGGTIFFPPGNFLHTDILQLGSNLTMMGSGPRKTVLKPLNPATAAIECVNAQNCGIVFLRIVSTATSRRQNDDSADIVITNSEHCRVSMVDIDGSASAGILIHGSTDIQVSGSHIDNTMADGVHAVHGSRDILIEDNVANNTGDDSFAAVAYAADPQTYNVTIRNNISRNSHARGVTCIGAAGCFIDNNRIFSPKAHGIAIDYENAYQTHHPSSATVTNNVVRGASMRGMRGILVDGADDVKLKGNLLTESNPIFVHESTRVRKDEPGE